MTPEQFARVESLFEEACAQPDEGRAAWLRDRCADDPEVLRKVERMLVQDAAPTGVFDASSIRTNVHVAAEHWSEQRLREEFDAGGQYRVLSLLGEGGFGSVYRAEQLSPVRRAVALKIIKLGMDTKRILARFEAERQTLAIMNHPGIARLLDAGVTLSGRPYFVMELIEGTTITAYCEDNSLSMQERLELFVQVCEAIRHAHQKGVLHRDIKPSNVLIVRHDGAARPVVIDFGIARALNVGEGADEGVMTELGQMIGTPEYMSPEQAGGGSDIDTRTDVYALGILLYRLLTGTTPFSRPTSAAKSLAELQRLICEQDPQRPSARLRQAKTTNTATKSKADPIAASATPDQTLFRTLQRDLDWIVMKAIEKERSHRYATVDALIADIRRYQDGEPVLARPQSVSYRFRKFASRNRGPLITAIVAVILLMAGSVGTGIGMVQAKRQAKIAIEEAAIANAISDFLNYDLLTAIADQNRGHDVTMKEILDEASRRIGGRFGDKPRVELGVRSSLGRSYSYLGLYDEATAHLERAVQIGQSVPGVPAPPHIDALMILADILSKEDRPDKAEELLQRALALGIELEGETGWYPLLIMNSLAQAQRRLGNSNEAEELYKRIIAARIKMEDSAKNRSELLTARVNLGTLYFLQDRLDEAEPIMRQTLADAIETLGPDHNVTQKATYDLAGLLRKLGRPAEAQNMLVPLADAMRRSRGDRHLYTLITLRELAAVYAENGKLEDALSIHLELAEAHRPATGEANSGYTAAATAIADLYDQIGRPQEAEDWRARLAGEK